MARGWQHTPEGVVSPVRYELAAVGARVPTASQPVLPPDGIAQLGWPDNLSYPARWVSDEPGPGELGWTVPLGGQWWSRRHGLCRVAWGNLSAAIWRQKWRRARLWHALDGALLGAGRRLQPWKGQAGRPPSAEVVSGGSLSRGCRIASAGCGAEGSSVAASGLFAAACQVAPGSRAPSPRLVRRRAKLASPGFGGGGCLRRTPLDAAALLAWRGLGGELAAAKGWRGGRSAHLLAHLQLPFPSTLGAAELPSAVFLSSPDAPGCGGRVASGPEAAAQLLGLCRGSAEKRSGVRAGAGLRSAAWWPPPGSLSKPSRQPAEPGWGGGRLPGEGSASP